MEEKQSRQKETATEKAERQKQKEWKDESFAQLKAYGLFFLM